MDIKRFVNESEVFKKYFFNTGWFFVEKILRILFSFGISILLARYFGPEYFGILSFAISYASLGIPISNLGLDAILVKEFVNKKFKDVEILGTALVLRIIGTSIVSLALFLIYYFFLFHNTKSWEVYVVLMLFVANFFQIFNVIEFYFQAKVLYKYATISLSLSMFFTNILRALFVYQEKGLLWISGTYVVEYSILAGCLLFFLPKVGEGLRRWKVNTEFAKKILNESWPLVLSSVMVTIYMKIDQVMIKEMMTNKEVGFYSTGIKFSEFFYFLPVAVSKSLSPLLAKNYYQDEKLYEHRLIAVMGVTFWSFLGLAIVFQLFSLEIIEMLFGSDYYPSHEVLKVHGFAGMITGMSVFLAQRYVLTETSKQSFYGTIFGAIINIILNLILIPRIGVVGAAWATVVSYHCPHLLVGIVYERKIITILCKSIFYPFKLFQS